MSDVFILAEVANMLGVDLGEKFTIKPTEYGKCLKCETNEKQQYVFGVDFFRIDYNENGKEILHNDNEKIFYDLCNGLYEVVKIKGEIK